MKKYFKRFTIFSLLTIASMGMTAMAANDERNGASVDGGTYHLPKTAIRVTMKVEKTTYKPGELAGYANRFMKLNGVSLEESVNCRILDVNMVPFGIPDPERVYSLHIDKSHNISRQVISEDNILRAINADVAPAEERVAFVPAKKVAALDPYKYLNQDILSAGSKLKMAQLCAKEIYDIRESRNELTRGQADYMPKDGEQLRVMLQNLDVQEAAIRMLFEGTTEVDTTEVTLTFVPRANMKDHVLFRFSKINGVVEVDDLSGEAYYVTVDDLHSMPEGINDSSKKAPKDETGVWVVLPGKIHISIKNLTTELASMDVSAAQFGTVENLNEPLFTKKVLTSLILNPYNGGIDKIESNPIK